MKYSKELYDRVRQNLRMFDYPRFDDGDIDALLDEIDRLQNQVTDYLAVNAELVEKVESRDEELKITDGLLKEATETIGAVIACCTYNANEDARIGIYGIDQKAFTMIDQFITHYNDTVSAGKVSVDVKRDLSDAEIEELGAQEAEKRGEK